jgi:hypothetical protein
MYALFPREEARSFRYLREGRCQGIVAPPDRVAGHYYLSKVGLYLFVYL